MKNYLVPLFALGLLYLSACSNDNYPDNMTRAERKAYYEEFNSSKTEEEWAAIRQERQERSAEEPAATTDEEEVAERNPGSVPVSIRNNSLLPRKVRIKDNVLAFKPLETRYVGFPAGTECYLLHGDSEKYLFTISTDNKDEQFKIFH
ncbi:MAG: hypothetical protein WBB45_12025 [Cyclobacteriaceae bacterium]